MIISIKNYKAIGATRSRGQQEQKEQRMPKKGHD